MQSKLSAIAFAAAISIGLIGCGGETSENNDLNQESSSSSTSSVSSETTSSSSEISSSSSVSSESSELAVLSGFDIIYPEHIKNKNFVDLKKGTVPHDLRQEFSNHMGHIISEALMWNDMGEVHDGSGQSIQDIVVMPSWKSDKLLEYTDNRMLLQAYHLDEYKNCYTPSKDGQFNSSINTENADGSIGSYMKIEYPWQRADAKLVMTTTTSAGKIEFVFESSGSNYEIKSMTVGYLTVYNYRDAIVDHASNLSLQINKLNDDIRPGVMSNMCPGNIIEDDVMANIAGAYVSSNNNDSPEPVYVTIDDNGKFGTYKVESQVVDNLIVPCFKEASAQNSVLSGKHLFYGETKKSANVKIDETIIIHFALGNEGKLLGVGLSPDETEQTLVVPEKNIYLSVEESKHSLRDVMDNICVAEHEYK